MGEPHRTDLEEVPSEPEDDPFDLETLAAVWAEQLVTFGPGSGCPQAGNERQSGSSFADLIGESIDPPVKPAGDERKTGRF